MGPGRRRLPGKLIPCDFLPQKLFRGFPGVASLGSSRSKHKQSPFGLVPGEVAVASGRWPALALLRGAEFNERDFLVERYENGLDPEPSLDVLWSRVDQLALEVEPLVCQDVDYVVWGVVLEGG